MPVFLVASLDPPAGLSNISLTPLPVRLIQVGYADRPDDQPPDVVLPQPGVGTGAVGVSFIVG